MRDNPPLFTPYCMERYLAKVLCFSSCKMWVQRLPPPVPLIIYLFAISLSVHFPSFTSFPVLICPYKKYVRFGECCKPRPRSRPRPRLEWRGLVKNYGTVVGPVRWTSTVEQHCFCCTWPNWQSKCKPDVRLKLKIYSRQQAQHPYEIERETGISRPSVRRIAQHDLAAENL